YAMDEAKAYFDRAMALLDTLPETDANAELRISLLANQRWVMIHLFKISEYYDLLSRYEVLLTKIVNPGLVGSFYERLGFCEWFFGLLDRADQNLTKAAQMTEMVHNAEDAGHAYTFLAWIYVWTGDFRKVLDCTEKAVRHIEQDFNIRTPVVALNASSLAWSFLGRWDAAVEEGKRSLRAAMEFSDNSLICQASFILGTAYALKGELGIAAEHMEIALEKAKTPMDTGFVQLFRAPILCRRGEMVEGIGIMESLLRKFQSAHSEPFAVVCSTWLGEGYWLASEHEKAWEMLANVVERANRIGMRYFLAYAHRILGEVAMAMNVSQAAKHFDESVRIANEIKAENELALAYGDYGRLCRLQGRTVEARDCFTQALEILDRLGTLIEPDKVRQELAELPQE
ncbi:MAG: tetratricopeptide repeat protein, partial [Deltaproteobacteria bacterium]